MFCTKCGRELEQGETFCNVCGAEGSSEEQEIQSEYAESLNQTETVQNEEIHTEYSEKLNNTQIIGRFIRKIIIGIVLLVMAVFVIQNGYGFVAGFLGEDGNIEDMPIVYIKNKADILMESKNKKDVYKITDIQGTNYSSSFVQFTEDNSIVFFADDLLGGEFKLYYRKTNQKVPKGQNANSKGVKIANGVNSFLASPNGKFVLYRKNDRLFYSNLKKETSIAKDVSYYWMSKDLKHIMFKKSGGDLYICDTGFKPEPEKIDSNVSSIAYMDEYMKEVYYIKEDNLYKKELKKDTVKIAEKVMAAEMIEDKLFYTEINDDMTCDLYMIKGNESKKIGKELTNVNFNTRVLTKANGSDVSYSILKADGTVIKADSISSKAGAMSVSKEERFFYCVEDIENGKGVLNRYELSKTGLGDKVQIAEDVSGFEIEDDALMVIASGYLGIYEDDKFTELSTTSNEYEYYNGTVYYFDGYSTQNSSGDLIKYKNGKKDTIDTDVKNIVVRSENDCYYLKDYSDKTQSGDLYRKNGRKPKKVDTDVNVIIK